MLNRFFIVFFVPFLFSVIINVPSAFAATPPDFPACTNPQGPIRSQYNNGVHGVVGNSAEFKGKDTVYTVNENQVLQCLCTDDGQGIQTNWWKISSLNDSEIQVLKNSGWYYVPNGALWGLDNAPYMAKNNSYTCKGDLGGIGGGDVLGLATTKSDLAATGNKAALYSLIIVGLGSILLIFGLLKRRVKRD